MKAARLSAALVAGFLLSVPYVRSQMASNNVEKRVNDILAQMSFADKLSYIGGTGFFDVKAIPGVNLPLNPQLFQTDAGLGVRVTPASVGYPGGPVLAATWNPDRARDLGTGLGRDTRARGFFTVFSLLNLYLTGRYPAQDWFANRRHVQRINDGRQRDDRGLYFPPRFTAAGGQTFSANIAK